MDSQVPTARRSPVALWLTMMGIGLVLYGIFAAIPSAIGSVLGLLVPGIVGAIVWSVWDPITDLDDAGIVAGLLTGVGAMAVRAVVTPHIEWFSLAGIVPDEFSSMVGMIPIPFAYGFVGHYTGKIIRVVTKRGAPKKPASPGPATPGPMA